MQSVSLDAALHFDLHAAIQGWLLTAAQPKLQHLQHRTVQYFKISMTMFAKF
jgi:hypothetical protein